MKLLICGGGTAGHVYPAIAVARAMAKREPGLTVLALGSGARNDRTLFESAGITFAGTGAAALTGAGPRLPLNAIRMVLALARAFKKVGAFRPNAAVSTGAYASFPGALACFLRRVPQVLIVIDARPGRAARMIGRFATHVAAATREASTAFAASKTSVTGLPLRPEFADADGRRARKRFGIDEGRELLLIAGGSQGSRTINAACAAALPELLQLGDVVHLTGEADAARMAAVASALPSDLRRAYHPVAFLNEGMADLMAASDLAISRAGGTVHELAAAGLPAILTPGTFAHGHQRANAQRMADAGAALVLEESDFTQKQIVEAVRQLLLDRARLARMAAAASSLGSKDAAETVAAKVWQLATRTRA